MRLLRCGEGDAVPLGPCDIVGPDQELDFQLLNWDTHATPSGWCELWVVFRDAQGRKEGGGFLLMPGDATVGEGYAACEGHHRETLGSSLAPAPRARLCVGEPPEVLPEGSPLFERSGRGKRIVDYIQEPCLNAGHSPESQALLGVSQHASGAGGVCGPPRLLWVAEQETVSECLARLQGSRIETKPPWRLFAGEAVLRLDQLLLPALRTAGLAGVRLVRPGTTHRPQPARVVFS
eukprot:Hpha_TRINITY_DN16219_c3_g1::TRINITY_DN16219_c3_g1_i1::g.12399::m.12399